jgi:copper(I)-binding protein
MQRRRLLQAAGASGLVFAGLPARACEFYSTNLRITHPWTRATPEDAASAIVCMRFDEVLKDDRLIGVETLVARGAEIGGRLAQPAVDFHIPQGRETLLSERDTWLRLTGLTMPLEVGRSYPLHLVFETGGAVRTDLSVDYARFR